MNTIEKARPMSKDEVASLISLVDSSKIITSKATNAANNKLKDEAWAALTETFNAGSIFPRTTAQLRLKWENLKKLARKRAAKMRSDRLKTGGGPGGYFPPDESLDKVASMLGTTCLGFSVDLGGDAEVLQEDIVVVEIEETPFDTPSTSTLPQPNEPLQGIPLRGLSSKKKILKRKHQMSEIESRIKRNEAVADYYNLKKTKLEMQQQQQNLEIEKLKLENEYLRRKLAQEFPIPQDIE